MKYTYKDILTGKIRYTQGTFTGWTQGTGLIGCRYAIFSTRKTQVLVPEYLLTREAKEAIKPYNEREVRT